MGEPWDEDLFDVAGLLRAMEDDAAWLKQIAEEDTVADLLAQLEKDEADMVAWLRLV